MSRPGNQAIADKIAVGIKTSELCEELLLASPQHVPDAEDGCSEQLFKLLDKNDPAPPLRDLLQEILFYRHGLKWLAKFAKMLNRFYGRENLVQAGPIGRAAPKAPPIRGDGGAALQDDCIVLQDSDDEDVKDVSAPEESGRHLHSDNDDVKEVPASEQSGRRFQQCADELSNAEEAVRLAEEALRVAKENRDLARVQKETAERQYLQDLNQEAERDSKRARH